MMGGVTTYESYDLREPHTRELTTITSYYYYYYYYYESFRL
jgi:hypothetical protein